MIIYGYRSTHLATGLQTEKCENCSTMNSVQVSIFQRYAHVFWIPFFPLGKIGASECSHCKQVLASKKFPPATKAVYDDLKNQAKAPIWVWSGVGMVILIIAFGIFKAKQSEKQNRVYIKAPQAGDVYSVKTEDGKFTTYKVGIVRSDSVFIMVNAYEVDKRAGLDELRKKAEYSKEVYGFHRDELAKMLESGEITNVDRD